MTSGKLLVAKVEKGLRCVEPLREIAEKWQEFVDIDETELFSSLARSVVGIDTNKQVITAHNTGMLCTNGQDMLGLVPCTHG